MAYRSLQAHHVQMGTLAHRTHAVLPRLSPCNRSWTRGLPRQLGRTVKTALVEAPVATAPLVASDTQPKVPSEQLDSSSDKFDWFAAWYPVAALDTLKPDRPTKVQLLGQDFVVWRDNQGEWQAFEDACPHRLAPLSEGRIHPEHGLQCAYHGWTFGSDGACTSIPQIGDAKAHATACSSQHSAVKRYPLKVLHGLLWLYPDHSADAWLAAIDAVPSAASAELLSGELEVKSPWFQRDVPMSLDTLIENFMDPAHFPQSHHGVVGDRDSEQAMDIRPVREVTRDGGFAMMVGSPATAHSYLMEFTPPCLGRHNFPGVTMLLYGIPLRMGWVRIIMTMTGPPGSTLTRPMTPELPGVVNAAIDALDKVPWLQHIINRNAIIDGDGLFLHAVERKLYSRGDHTSWKKQYYMPGSNDLPVIAWRKWMDRHGINLPTLPKTAADLGPALTREQIFDRYNQHTKDCPHCSTALRNITIAAGVLAAVACVALASVWVAVTAVTPAVPLVSTYSALHLGVAAVAGAVAGLLWRLRQKFIFEDYIHAEHH